MIRWSEGHRVPGYESASQHDERGLRGEIRGSEELVAHCSGWIVSHPLCGMLHSSFEKDEEGHAREEQKEPIANQADAHQHVCMLPSGRALAALPRRVQRFRIRHALV